MEPKKESCVHDIACKSLEPSLFAFLGWRVIDSIRTSSTHKTKYV